MTPPNYTSALKGLRDYLGARATVLHSDGADPAEVGRIARDADAVVVVAGARWDEVGEYISDDEGMKPSRPAQKRPLKVKLPFLHPIEMSGGDYVPLALGRGTWR